MPSRSYHSGELADRAVGVLDVADDAVHATAKRKQHAKADAETKQIELCWPMLMLLLLLLRLQRV